MQSWYAIYTKPRSEKKINTLLIESGVESYLPLLSRLKQWSDRKKWVEEPLFRSYIFVHIHEKECYYIVKTPGIVRIVSFSGKPAVIPDWQINSLRILLANSDELEVTEDNLQPGEKVEVISGPMAGLIGDIVSLHNTRRMVLRIEHLGLSLNVNIPLNLVKRINLKADT